MKIDDNRLAIRSQRLGYTLGLEDRLQKNASAPPEFKKGLWARMLFCRVQFLCALGAAKAWDGSE